MTRTVVDKDGNTIGEDTCPDPDPDPGFHLPHCRPLGERREVLVAVSEHSILDLVFLSGKGLPSHVMVLEGPGLPEDARVERVQQDWACRQILFVVSHPSFEPVPEGVPPPRLPGDFGFVWRAVPTHPRSTWVESAKWELTECFNNLNAIVHPSQRVRECLERVKVLLAEEGVSVQR